MTMRLKRLVRLLAYACVSLLVLAALGLAGLYVSLKQGIVPVARVEDFPPPPPRTTDKAGNEFRYQPVGLHEISQPMLLVTLVSNGFYYFENPNSFYKPYLQVMLQNTFGSGYTTFCARHVTHTLAERLVPKSASYSLHNRLQRLLAGYELGQTLSPEELLMLFLNHSYYGNNQFGVEAAARYYFGVAGKDLSLAQSAQLHTVWETRGAATPITRPDKSCEYMEYILGGLYKQRYITQEQCDLAMVEALCLAPPEKPDENQLLHWGTTILD